MTNNNIVRLLNHLGEHAQSTWWGRVCVKHAVAALIPLLYGCIDGLLHICAIEVDLRALGEIIETTREAEYAINKLAKASSDDGRPTYSHSKGQVVATW